jgi:FixJ family two-component response regulator
VARQLHLLRPELPIILASGFSADVSRETLDDAGICELLEKPISRDLLAEVVQRSLAGKGVHLNGVDIGVPAI